MEKNKSKEITQLINRCADINQPETVKFKALALIKEAEEFLFSAEQKLVCVEALKGDNEAQEWAQILRESIERVRKTLHRGALEAQEAW